MKDQAPVDRLRSLSSELQQVFHGLGGAGRRAPAGPTVPPEGADDDDVIDADFTVS